jgi:hypothetical protein
MKKPTSTIEVKSGYTFEAGFQYLNPNLEHFSTQFLLGYKKDALSRILKKKKNVPITLTRKYISVIENYHMDNTYLGLGLSYHIKPQVDYTYNSHTTRVFDNALGLIGQAGYNLTKNFDLNLKATWIEYKIQVKRKNKIYKRQYNTSSIGIFLTYKF